MEIQLRIGGIGFHFQCEKEMELKGLLRNYLVSKSNSQIEVRIVCCSESRYSEGVYLGEDIFSRYYKNADSLQIELKGSGEPSAMILCRDQMRVLCYEIYPQMQREKVSLDRIVSFLPMRQILHQFEAFILHSSRISVGGNAILFSGVSGAGKTTQARLWKEYEDVPYLCNDRTIVRYEKGVWNTYGYFEDGSEPIADNTCFPLGAIVFLKKGNENSMRRLNGRAAVKALMEQIFMDQWDQKMISGMTEQVVNLLNDIPIYEFDCVADQTAVEYLKKEFIQKGVTK